MKKTFFFVCSAVPRSQSVSIENISIIVMGVIINLLCSGEQSSSRSHAAQSFARFFTSSLTNLSIV